MEHSRNGPTFHPLQGTDIKAHTQPRHRAPACPTRRSRSGPSSCGAGQTDAPARDPAGHRAVAPTARPPGSPARRARTPVPARLSPPSALPTPIAARAVLVGGADMPTALAPGWLAGALGHRPAARSGPRQSPPSPAWPDPGPDPGSAAPHQPQLPADWRPAAAAAAAVARRARRSFSSGHIPASRARPSPQDITQSPAASPHLHRSPARVFPASPPRAGPPHPTPSPASGLPVPSPPPATRAQLGEGLGGSRLPAFLPGGCAAQASKRTRWLPSETGTPRLTPPP